MKVPTLSAAVAIAALASSISASVTMNIARTPRGVANTNGLKKRQLSPRATITEALANNFTGGDYIAQVTVGTPGQTQTLAIDTGSSDVWMLASTADLCTDPELQYEYQTGGCASTFDSSKSSTFQVVNASAFEIQYADNSGAEGDYITDNFSIGGATIKALEMGLAYNATLQTGLMGIGYDTNEASTAGEDGEGDDGFIYPSIIDQMMSQGLIATKAYSLYLDDYEASTGSIIFGGLDSDKYSGSLLQIPIAAEQSQDGSLVYAEFAVALTGFSITGQAGSTTALTSSSYQTPAILDSGTTLTYLPGLLVETLYKDLNVVSDEYSGISYVACSTRDNNPKMTFNFGFGGTSGINIAVPVNEMIFDLTGLFSTGGVIPSIEGIDGTPCAFGIYDGDSQGSSGGPYILGDTFLRSAYVVYDLQNNLIALAQTNFNSTSSNIVEFQASATSIPDVSGVASSAQVTETNTGILGGGGGPKTTGTASTTGSSATAAKTTTSSSTGTGTGTAAATTTTSKSSGASGAPAFDARGLFVLGISSAFAVLGATFILA